MRFYGLPVKTREYSFAKLLFLFFIFNSFFWLRFFFCQDPPQKMNGIIRMLS